MNKVKSIKKWLNFINIFDLNICRRYLIYFVKYEILYSVISLDQQNWQKNILRKRFIILEFYVDNRSLWKLKQKVLLKNVIGKMEEF